MDSEEREKIENWIKEKLKEGVEPSVIKEVLKEKGYNPKIVDEIKTPEKSNQPLKVLILMAFILGIIAVGGFLFIHFLKSSNQELTEQGWKFVKFEKVNETTYRIVGATPFKNYVIKTEVGKFFVIYPELRLINRSLSGYGWVKELSQNVSENSTVEIKFAEKSFNFSTFPVFILKRDDNTYAYPYRFSGLNKMLDCKNETNFVICKGIFNFSDACVLHRNYTKEVECPLFGIHDFYFFLFTFNGTATFVKQISFSNQTLLGI